MQNQAGSTELVEVQPVTAFDLEFLVIFSSHIMIAVRYERGTYLPELDLWLDPWDDRPAAFISHAHSDHIGNHGEVILTEVTAKLMAARLPGTRQEHQLAYEIAFPFRGSQLTLLPAGHIHGSAQLLVEYNESSLLYSGDFKLRAGQASEPIVWRAAETLIMETTYGLPKFVFPPTEKVIGEITKFCRETIEDGAVPILFGYSLGKAQEVLAALNKCELRVVLHASVYQMTKLYRRYSRELTAFNLYESGDLFGSVFLCPPHLNGTRLIQSIKPRRTAILTGWALNPGAAHRYQCDAAFPLSDHADYPDLIRYVQLVQPRRVLTLHGYAREFAEDLRRRGIEAWALGEDNQLEFSISVPADSLMEAVQTVHGAVEPVKEGFGQFTQLCEEISRSTGKLRKVELLANYLQSLTEDELRLSCVFLTGHAFSRADARALQVGWSVIRKALIQTASLEESEFRRIASGYGDAAKIAYETLLGKTEPREHRLANIRSIFERLEFAKGPVAKTSLLSDSLHTLTALDGSYVIRILTGDLRIGLKEGLVEESIARAFNAPLDDVREAHMLSGDIGETAVLARKGLLKTTEIALFRPVMSMLAVPEPSAKAAFERVERDFSEADVFVEQKFDGIRAQLHVGPDRTEVYSRDLRNISNEFPELTDLPYSHNLILDGEIIAFDSNRRLTFFDLQRRLGRKRGRDLFDTDDIPILFMAFDLLLLDKKSLVREPLRLRRSLLESLALPKLVQCSPITLITQSEELEQSFQAARRAAAEGLMIKDPGSQYQPGRRGGSWIKLKQELATLDVVVIGAEKGHGKRSHVLSDYTFAVKNSETGMLETIGKAYSGLTDAEIEELTEYFEKNTIRRVGRFHEVVPELVLEVAFDSIQPSSRHSSGLALRFPRIKAIRRDKSVDQIDTVQNARRIAGLSPAG
jgi:DNA ligase 1